MIRMLDFHMIASSKWLAHVSDIGAVGRSTGVPVGGAAWGRGGRPRNAVTSVAPSLLGETTVLGARYGLPLLLVAQLDRVVIKPNLAAHHIEDGPPADAALGHGVGPRVTSVAP